MRTPSIMITVANIYKANEIRLLKQMSTTSENQQILEFYGISCRWLKHLWYQ